MVRVQIGGKAGSDPVSLENLPDGIPFQWEEDVTELGSEEAAVWVVVEDNDDSEYIYLTCLNTHTGCSLSDNPSLDKTQVIPRPDVYLVVPTPPTGECF